jgi:hypothetical protein
LETSLSIVERNSSVSMEALRRRCTHLILNQGGRDTLGPEADERIKHKLRKLELKFPWNKPQPMAAQRAFGMVLKELVNARAINPQVLPLVWEAAGGPSLNGYELELQAKPAWVIYPIIPRTQYDGLDKDSWLASAEEDLYVSISPDWFVLAERSSVKLKIMRQNAESIRLCLPTPLDIEDIDKSLWKIPRLFSLDCLEPLYDTDEEAIVCQLFQPYFGELREPTITLCPRVLKQLEWKRSSKNPFDVYDKDGAITAKTIRWVDGTDQIDAYGPDIVGNGQAIVLSKAGRAQLEQLKGSIVRAVKVIRRVQQENDGLKERVITYA